MRFSTVLFDFDGTLADSIELILESYRHTLRVHRGETPADDLWLKGLGTPLRVQFRSFSDSDEEIEAMIRTYRTWNLTHHDQMVRPYPGAVEAVRELKARGVALGIVSSKNRDGLEKGIRLCGLDGLFDTLVTSDDLEASKPDPAPVRVALSILASQPSATLLVGDSPHDMMAGRAAGIRTAAVLWGPFTREDLAAQQPDHWLRSFGDLLALVA